MIDNALTSDIDAFLGQYAGQSVLFYAQPGNGGDCLIAVGTHRAFQKSSIFARNIGLDDDVSGGIVFLGGGGNYVGIYDDISRAIERFRHRAAKIILLPHTIREHERQIARLDERFTIFCRDPPSYQHVRSLATKAEVRLAHDMAFHLDANDLMQDRALAERAEPVFRARLAKSQIAPDSITRLETVDYRRLDMESPRSAPTSFLDISDIFQVGVTLEAAPVGAWCMLKAIGLAKSVVSDRLHVGIGCALLNKPCLLQDNSYGKNSAVYNYSLRGRFPTITFDESSIADGRRRLRPRRRSWKRRLALLLGRG
jgi:exopolysaccharide biosynthesis predicted pyruvyltransferase EpsI